MTGVIILAAGASTRMGQPKQQLVHEGKSLLQHAIKAATNSVCKPVIVVLGANAEAIQPHIADDSIYCVLNENWQEGMASSIRTGLTALQKIQPAITSVILMLCDQPFVEASLLNNLVQLKNEKGKGIVACAYNNTIGAPALFDKVFFPELLSLQGGEGAKKLLSKHTEAVAVLPFPQGAVDIDTPADYNSLISPV